MIDPLLENANPYSWSYRDLIGQPVEPKPRVNPRTVSASANVNPLDDMVLVTGNTTLTLETAVGCGGRIHLFLKTDSSNTMTVAAASGETIDGEASLSTTSQYGALEVVSNGTTWHAKRIPPDLIIFKDSVTGAAAINLSAYLNLKVKGLKKTFGATGDGVADDYTKIQSAFTTAGKIIEIEEGTFLTNTNPPVPTCAGIVGWGPKVSKLKAGTGVTKVLSLTTASTTYFRKMDDFAVHGNATASARGIILGDGALYAGLAMRNVNVEDFTGTSAIGIYYRDIVGLTAENVRVSGCTENEVIQQDAESGCPTTLEFLGGASRAALGIGTRVRQGNGILFRGRVFEGNTNEGLNITPGVGETITGLVAEDCWWEGNWPSDPTKYDIKINGADGTVYVELRGESKFNSACGDVHFTGTNVRAEVNGLRPLTRVLIENSAQVRRRWHGSTDLTIITDTSGILMDTAGMEWSTWSLAITGWTLGNATVVARHTRNGRQIAVEFAITIGTTTSIGAGTITITGLPSNAASTTGLKGVVSLLDASASNTYLAGIEMASATSIQMRNPLATIGTLPAGLVTNTQPFTFTTSDVIAGSFTYRL
jgi:hypothetical protein